MSNEVTEARTELGMDLKSFAKAVGVDRSTAFRWEQRGQFPGRGHTREFVQNLLNRHRKGNSSKPRREQATA